MGLRVHDQAWEGREVVMDFNGRAFLVERWRPGGHTYIPGSKSLVPKKPDETRFLSFSPLGISLLNELHEGLTLSSPGAPPNVTWNKSNVNMIPQATDIINFWKFHVPRAGFRS